MARADKDRGVCDALTGLQLEGFGAGNGKIKIPVFLLSPNTMGFKISADLLYRFLLDVSLFPCAVA